MRLFKALGALAVLAAVLVLPPLLLVTQVGNPWPAEGVTLQGPLTDGAILGVLACLVWLLWAQLVVCIAAEAAAAVSSARSSRQATAVPFTFGFQQMLARRLVGAVMVGLVAAPIAAAGAANATTAVPAVSTSVAEAPKTAAMSAAGDRAQDDDGRSTAGEWSGPVRSVKVQRLDTLWGIAERELGDGALAAQIAKLNDGRTMVDGMVFTAADNIRPGWELHIPDTRPAGDQAQAGTEARASEQEAAETQVVVEPGDSLSQIANDEYGDPGRWPAVYDANQAVIGANPDLIHPGQVLKLPDTQPPEHQPTQPNGDQVEPPAAEQPPTEQPPTEQMPTEQMPEEQMPEEPPAVEQPQAEQPPDHPLPEQEPGEDLDGAGAGAGADVGDQADVDEAEDAGLPVSTTFGIGALLAAAVISMIGARRYLQHRRRKSGQRIPLPADPDTQAVEQSLRSVADPVGVEHVDVALRDLAAGFAEAGAPLPVVNLARLVGDRFEVYLEAPAELPAPWEASAAENMWIYPAAAVDAIDHEHADQVSSPYPGLLTLGHDAEDGHLLVNLEHFGKLAISGDSEQTRAVAAAAAVDLATSTWGEDVIVSVIGELAGAEEVLRTGRLRYVPTVEDLELHDDELDVVVVFFDDDADPGDKAMAEEWLEELVDDGGVAVIAVGAQPETWLHLQVDGADVAQLHPLGLQLRPQLLDEGTYQLLLEILETADQPPTGGGNGGGGGRRDDHAPLTVAPDATEAADVDEAEEDHGAAAAAEEPAAEHQDPAGDDLDDEPQEDETPEERTPAYDGPGYEGGIASVLPGYLPDQPPPGAPAFTVPPPAGSSIPLPPFGMPVEDRPVAESTSTAHEPDEANETETDPVGQVDDSLPAGEISTGTSMEGEEPVPEVGPTNDPAVVAVDEATDDVVDEIGRLSPVASNAEERRRRLLDTGHPVIRLLDKIEILGVGALKSSSHTEKCTELATYLALFPDSTKDRLIDAVWHGRRVKDTYVTQVMSRLRNWLGVNPATSQDYLPRQARRLDSAVMTDWQIFTRTVGNDPTKASTEALEDALCLVGREPLGTEKGYEFTEYVSHDIVDGIVDVALELTRRRYMAGQWRQVDAAAALGVSVFVGNDELWRYRLLAAHETGTQVDMIDRVQARFTDLGFDLEPETQELVDALRDGNGAVIDSIRQGLL